MTTFTLTGTFLHQDGVTPIVGSPIQITADPFPLAGVVQASSLTTVTDANGQINVIRTTGVTGLYYVVKSMVRTPLFSPIRFLAPAAGATVDVSSLVFYNPGPAPSETLIAADLAAAQAAVASVAYSTWQGATSYVLNQTVQAPDGSLIKSNSARTSRASFDATEQTFWTAVSAKAGTIEQGVLAAATKALLGTFLQYVDPVNGNDSNDGYAGSRPKATLAAARTALPQPGGAGANHVGYIYPSGGDHVIGTVASSATGFQQDQGIHVIGVSSSDAVQGGTRIVYQGTGIAWQTGKDSASIFAGTHLRDVKIITLNGTAATLLNVRNAQNNCVFERVTLGDTAVGGSNPVTSALRVDTDAGFAGGYPGFIHFDHCWINGGSIGIDVTPGTTGINFTGGGQDLFDDATIGFRVNAGPNDAKATVRWLGAKQEIHNGPNNAPTPALRVDSTAGQVTAGSHTYGISWVTPAGESAISLTSASVTNDGTHTSNTVTLPLATGAVGTRVTSRKVYRTVAGGGGNMLLLTTVANNTTTSITDTTPDASLGAAYSVPASGAVGNPIPFQWGSIARFKIDAEVLADAPTIGTPVISYTASPTSPTYPRGTYEITSLNYQFQFKGSSTALGGGTIPKPAIAANTNYTGMVNFLSTPLVRDLLFAGSSASSITITSGGTGATVATTASVFSSNERRGQIAITIGTAPGANPFVQINFVNQTIGNGGPTCFLSVGTKSDGTASPADWTNWQVDYSGTNVGRMQIKWCGAAAPTAGNIYYLQYLVLA